VHFGILELQRTCTNKDADNSTLRRFLSDILELLKEKKLCFYYVKT